MKTMKRKLLCGGLGLIAAFALWTAAVCLLDAAPVGPLDSRVGLAGMNRAFHQWTGVHMGLYALTDWLGLVPVICAAGFGLLGLMQWLRRGHIRRVDADILLLGGFYLAVLAAYILFEKWVVNYRPVLIEGRLEASYPSSTTLLVMCVVPAAMLQLRARLKHKVLRRCTLWALGGFAAFMVTGRLLSGVHWLSDIIGGALLSAGLVLVYAALISPEDKNSL